jgi:FkbM family methyltransferase
MLKNIRRSIYGVLGRGLQLVHGEDVPYIGTPLKVPSKWIASYTRARIYLRKYEQAESALVRQYLMPTVPTIELGCGIGVVAREIMARLQPGTPYVGFEANPELVEVARTNLGRLGREGWSVQHAAIAGRSQPGETIRFAITDGNFRFSSTDLVDQPGTQVINVPVTTLYNVINDAAWDQFQVVSDIEGAERQFLDHDSAAIERCVQFIIELHDGEGFRIGDLKRRIEELGFECVDHRIQTFVFRRPARA